MDRGKGRRGGGHRGGGGHQNRKRESRSDSQQQWRAKKEKREEEEEKEEHQEDDDKEQGEEGEVEFDEGSPKVFFSEKETGVCKFVQPEGYGLLSGELKVCPEDFYVNEIDQNGVAFELKHPIMPQDESAKSKDVGEEQIDKSAEITLQSRIDNLKADLSKYPSLADEDYVTIKSLIESESRYGKVTLSTEISDKSIRGVVHQTLRKHLHPLVTSSTGENNHISVQKASQDLIRKDQRRLRAESNQPAHLELILRKRNVDSNHCISELSRVTRVPRRSFAIAGTKDKRAVTTQKVTVRHGSQAEFLKRCSGPMTCGQSDQVFEVGDLVQTNSTTFLGNLKGNRFTIVLKNLQRKENVPLDLTKWCEKGYVNYYGAQRFGTAEVGTHQVGVALINREYSTAIDLILKPRQGEDERLTEIRQAYVKDGDAQALLNNLPKRCTAERAVASGLVKHGKKENDCWKILQLIPRNTLTMYLHALQFLIWNRVASIRIERYGVEKVMVGETVMKKDGTVSVVKSETDAQEKYTIADVVLPLPGTSVEYPETEFANKKVYDEILIELGIKNGLKQLQLTSPRELSLAGSYRTLSVIPQNVQYRLAKYSNANDVLLTKEGHFPLPTEWTEGSLEALLMSFTLPAGAYATMALRELLHNGQ